MIQIFNILSNYQIYIYKLNFKFKKCTKTRLESKIIERLFSLEMVQYNNESALTSFAVSYIFFY